MNTMKYLIYVFVFAIGFSSCISSKEIIGPAEDDSVEVGDEVDPIIKITATIGDAGNSDGMTIKSASIVGNKMLVTVEYSGGCEDHTFEMVGSEVLMKSMPPKRNVYLIHHSNSDHCRELIQKTLEIDIKALAASPTPESKVVILINGYMSELTYTYK